MDGGRFDWDNGKFPELTEPDENYHGVVYTKQFGSAAYINKLRATLLRDMGPTMSPFNAWLTNLGMETLAVRMDRHCAMRWNWRSIWRRIPRWLGSAIRSYRPARPMRWRKSISLKAQAGSLLLASRAASRRGKQFINSVKLASLVVHVGDLRSHVLHPASMTHRQLSEEAQIASGVLPDMIRFSVGIENVEDIKADLEQALARIEA